ncbi:NDP-sugar synthase [Nocardioidaceae bacterium]|nr:NDP-sugar synthase [Nocardioidaceae bacterium]
MSDHTGDSSDTPDLGTIEAVIVAGGFGSRMMPLTERRPKHLLEVAGVPFVEHQLTRLAQAGVGTVVLATSYHAEMFEPVLGDGSRFGLELVYVTEEEPLGTGGAIRNVSDALTDDPDAAIVILNGDILSSHDLRAQLLGFRTPREGRAVDVSLHLVTVDDARAFGAVPTDEVGRVTDFLEKSEDPVTNQINAGCYVFRRSVVDAIPAGEVVSVEYDTFPGLLRDDAVVVGHVDAAYWRDVGHPHSVVGASCDLVLGVGSSPAFSPTPGAAAWVSSDAVVGEGAVVDGGSAVSAGAEIGEGAVVSGSVVHPGATVGPGARVVDSVVACGARIGAGAGVISCAVGDDAEVPDGAQLSDEKIPCG